MRCGTYYVYENRKKRTGRILPLKVIVAPAVSGHSNGPLFFFAGGPSEAVTDYAVFVPFTGENANNDVVMVDQRGTGEGNSLDCKWWSAGDSLQKYFQAWTDQLLACKSNLEKTRDLSQYSTATFLQDVDKVRAALGYDKIIVRGGSYGSRAAIAYMKLFGPHVRMAVLSGLAPFENRLDLYTPRDTQTALEALFSDCAADPKCNAAYPHPAEDLADVRKRLLQRPAVVVAKHPSTGVIENITLSERWFSRLLASRLAELSAARKIPWLLQRARAGDFSDLVQERLSDAADGKGRALRAAVLCTEDISRIGLAELERETTGVLSDLGMYDSMYLCGSWPKTHLPARYFEPFTSEVPTLIISGDRDSLTAPRWGEVTRKSLPNSLHVIVPRAHSYRPDPCTISIVKQFYASGEVDGLNTSCVSAMSRPPFYIPDGEKTTK